jgi:hypothetical protein
VWVRLARTDDGGDSKRVKFVLLSWLGEAAGAMAKAKLTEHKAALQAAFQARAPSSLARSALFETVRLPPPPPALTRARTTAAPRARDDAQGTHVCFSVLERAALDTLEGTAAGAHTHAATNACSRTHDTRPETSKKPRMLPPRALTRFPRAAARS